MKTIIEHLEDVSRKRKPTADAAGFNKRFKNDQNDQRIKQNTGATYRQSYQDAYKQRDQRQRKNQLPPKQNRYIVEEGIQLQVTS